jgi:PHD/YefM family antitoxin component YafN of YafNO toxin-antitoxin module
MRLSSAEFLESFDKLSNQALAEPVTIVCNGQDRLVLLSIEEYERLKPRDRRVYAIEDMAPEQQAALEKAEVLAEYACFNAELKDWRP